MPPKRKPKDTDVTTFFPEEHNLYNKRMVFLAPSGGGKSFLIRDIMQKLPRIPIGRIIAGSEKYDPYYSKFCPDILISTEFNIKTIEEFFDRAVEITKLKNTSTQFKHVNNKSLLLLDDCFHKKSSWMKEQIISEVIMNGRHAGVTVMIAMQSPKGFQAELKGCIDFVFVAQHTSYTDRKTIFDNYSVGIKTFGQFNKIMDSLKENQFLVFKRNGTDSSKIIDNVFIYKAKDHPGFKMFSPLIWREHNNKYDPEYDKKNKRRKERDQMEKEMKEALKSKKKQERTHDIEIFHSDEY